MSMTVAPNKFVSLGYELYVGNSEERVLMEETSPERPLTYIQGMGMMLPEFEKHIFGLKAGDKFDFTLTSEQAYGPRVDEAVHELAKEMFLTPEGELDANVQEEKFAALRSGEFFLCRLTLGFGKGDSAAGLPAYFCIGDVLHLDWRVWSAADVGRLHRPHRNGDIYRPALGTRTIVEEPSHLPCRLALVCFHLFGGV